MEQRSADSAPRCARQRAQRFQRIAWTNAAQHGRHRSRPAVFHATSSPVLQVDLHGRLASRLVSCHTPTITTPHHYPPNDTIPFAIVPTHPHTLVAPHLCAMFVQLLLRIAQHANVASMLRDLVLKAPSVVAHLRSAQKRRVPGRR
eukprot:352444-Chlamydomonas_euryale.AAC.5